MRRHWIIRPLICTLCFGLLIYLNLTFNPPAPLSAGVLALMAAACWIAALAPVAMRRTIWATASTLVAGMTIGVIASNDNWPPWLRVLVSLLLLTGAAWAWVDTLRKDHRSEQRRSVQP